MKYEYNQIYISFKESYDHLKTLNLMGEDGWNLISSAKVDDHNIMYLFKREKTGKTLLNEERKVI